MRLRIFHLTTYRYVSPVLLHRHVLRLQPRNDPHQSLRLSRMHISPTTHEQIAFLDLNGNQCIALHFQGETEFLEIESQLDLETFPEASFHLDPDCQRLPMTYPESLQLQVGPFLGQSDLSEDLLHFIQTLTEHNHWDTLNYINDLNNTLSQQIIYMERSTGLPFEPNFTWSEKKGSCRDLAVLFMACCRAMGIAARFVSGYQALAPHFKHWSPQESMHAWAEVYLPGGGWRGFDPSLGEAVGECHIALAAAAIPTGAAPVEGGFSRAQPGQTFVSSQMDVRLRVENLSDKNSVPIIPQNAADLAVPDV